MKRLLWNGAPTLLLAVAAAGCSSLETSFTGPEDQPTTMQLRVEVPQSDGTSNSAVPGPSANVVVDDGESRLTITAVQIILDQVEFRRSSGEGCVDSDDPTQDDGDSCAELAVQPVVLDLPVASDPILSEAIAVETGTYEALEFDVVEATAADDPTLVGVSVNVQGSIDGQALEDASFTPTGEVELLLEDPIELEQGFSSGMTLTVDVASWFQVDGTVIDPAAAAQDDSLSAEVADRIMGSFSIRSGA